MDDTKAAVWTKEAVAAKLASDAKYVTAGLTTLFKLQTASEQRAGVTEAHNAVGFNKFDADPLTRLYYTLVRYGTLTREEMDHARRRLVKYSNQLARVANGEIRVPR